MSLMRWDVLDKELQTRGSGRFLEIGVRDGTCGLRVRASSKWGVDPNPKAPSGTYHQLFVGTSDSFFEQLGSDIDFDVIFIDGFHEAKQVLRDVENSLKHLRRGGLVVLHDCNPITEEAQLPFHGQRIWNGDVWRAIVHLRFSDPGLKTSVLDTDHGLGFVRPRSEPAVLTSVRRSILPFRDDAFLITWDDFERRRGELLGLRKATSWKVVIPSNSARRLRRCVKAIRWCHPEISLSDVIVVDDGARKQWRPIEEGPDVTWIDGVSPFVYARNVNLGIEAAGDADVVIVGDDVEPATRGIFDHMASYETIVSAGIRGPVGNYEQRYVGENGQTRPRLLTTPRKKAVQSWLAFICVYVPREIIRTCGLLDERFIGYGCDDRDFCKRALDSGFGLSLEPRLLAHHNRGSVMGSAYRSGDFKEANRLNQQLYREKWRAP